MAGQLVSALTFDTDCVLTQLPHSRNSPGPGEGGGLRPSFHGNLIASFYLFNFPRVACWTSLLSFLTFKDNLIPLSVAVPLFAIYLLKKCDHLLGRTSQSLDLADYPPVVSFAQVGD